MPDLNLQQFNMGWEEIVYIPQDMGVTEQCGNGTCNTTREAQPAPPPPPRTALYHLITKHAACILRIAT